jgi:hypothetical protein
VHYSLRLPELTCDHYELTDKHGGEKLGRFVFCAGEQLVLADRGYSHRACVAAVLEAKAEVLLRWNPATFPVEGPQGEPWDLLSRLRLLKAGQTRHWPLSFVLAGRRYRLRLCARRKALRKAARNQSGTPDLRSLELTEYVPVLTLMPEATLSAALVLELYRRRWQIELAFQRLKSLLAFGHVPKSSGPSAKILDASQDSHLSDDRAGGLVRAFFSPRGYDG